MRLTNACSCGAVFLASLTLFATIGSADIEDSECFWFSIELEDHPCSCFNQAVHPTDKCAAGDPGGYFNNGNEQGLYDTGCTDIVQDTCNNTAPNSAHDCGDVINCSLECDWSEDEDGFDGFPDDDWPNMPGKNRPCEETDKGSCNKGYGECVYEGA